MKPHIYTRVHNSSIKKTHGSHIENIKTRSAVMLITISAPNKLIVLWAKAFCLLLVSKIVYACMDRVTIGMKSMCYHDDTSRTPMNVQWTPIEHLRNAWCIQFQVSLQVCAWCWCDLYALWKTNKQTKKHMHSQFCSVYILLYNARYQLEAHIKVL